MITKVKNHFKNLFSKNPWAYGNRSTNFEDLALVNKRDFLNWIIKLVAQSIVYAFATFMGVLLVSAAIAIIPFNLIRVVFDISEESLKEGSNYITIPIAIIALLSVGYWLYKLTYTSYRVAKARAKDAGLSKMVAVLMFIPGLVGIGFIWLALAPSKGKAGRVSNAKAKVKTQAKEHVQKTHKAKGKFNILKDFNWKILVPAFLLLAVPQILNNGDKGIKFLEANEAIRYILVSLWTAFIIERIVSYIIYRRS